MKYFIYILLWAFEFGILYLLYRFVLNDIEGVWFSVIVGFGLFGYLLYHFGEFFDWKREREKIEMLEKNFPGAF